MDISYDPMHDDVNYSAMDSSSSILILDDDNNGDIKSKEADDPLSIRDTSCYSNETLDTKAAARLVFNVKKCVVLEKCSLKIPTCPPDVKNARCFVYVVRASSLLKPVDCNIDAVCPWTISKASGTTVKYFVEIENDIIKSATKAVKGTALKPHHRVMKKYYVRHQKFVNMTKTIFRCESESGSSLEEDTFVVVMYEFSAATKLHSLVHGNSKTNKAPLVHHPSYVKTQYQQQLKEKKPIDARKEVIEQNGGYANAPAEILLSRKHVYNLSSGLEGRKLQTASGRKKGNDWDAIESLKKDRTFFKEFAEGDGKRIFVTNDVAIENFKKNCLVPKDFVKNYQKAVDKALSDPEPYTAGKKLVEKEKKEERHRGGIAEIDTSFKVSNLLITTMYFTNPHIRKKKDGLPVSQFVCSMLSERRDKDTFLWMAQQLQKYVGDTDKVCKGFCHDGDRGFDQFHKIPFFDLKYCQPVGCKIHKAVNLKAYVPEEHENLAETFVFGSTNARGAHVTGIVDAVNKKTFEDQIEVMFELAAFRDNSDFKTWLTSQKNFIYERFSLESRLKAGFGFDTAATQTIECHNKNFKDDIKHRTYSVDELIPRVEEHCFKTLDYLIQAILHSDDFQLSKAKQGYKKSPKEWESLSMEEKTAILKHFGYEKWFDQPFNSPSNIPQFLLKHLESKQRKKLEQRGIELSKFCLYDDLIIRLYDGSCGSHGQSEDSEGARISKTRKSDSP